MLVRATDQRRSEFQLRDRAVPIDDPRLRSCNADVVEAETDWRPEDPCQLFAFDIEDATFIKYPEGPGQMLRWVAADQPAGR